MNSVNIAGRVLDEPSKSQSSNGISLARFKMAVDKAGKDSVYDVFEVVVFRELADLKLEIGQFIGVTGKLVSNNFEKEDKKYYNCSVIGNAISMFGC